MTFGPFDPGKHPRTHGRFASKGLAQGSAPQNGVPPAEAARQVRLHGNKTSFEAFGQRHKMLEIRRGSDRVGTITLHPEGGYTATRRNSMSPSNRSESLKRGFKTAGKAASWIKKKAR